MNAKSTRVENGRGRCWIAPGALVGFLVLVATSLSLAQGGKRKADSEDMFPFVKGTEWTYAGTVNWTENQDQERSKSIRWTSTVADSFRHGDIAGMLLKGGVWDLSWYDPQKGPQQYLLVRIDDKYYLSSDNAAELFSAVRDHGRKGLPQDFENYLWFETPMSQGDEFRAPDDPPRNDGMYEWVVESDDVKSLNVAGMSGKRRVYSLAYRTMPDHQIISIAPGVGITSYIYNHHGTVAQANVRLIAFHTGGVAIKRRAGHSGIQ